jgi:hypothetical protein
MEEAYISNLLLVAVSGGASNTVFKEKKNEYH